MLWHAHCPLEPIRWCALNRLQLQVPRTSPWRARPTSPVVAQTHQGFWKPRERDEECELQDAATAQALVLAPPGRWSCNLADRLHCGNPRCCVPTFDGDVPLFAEKNGTAGFRTMSQCPSGGSTSDDRTWERIRGERIQHPAPNGRTGSWKTVDWRRRWRQRSRMNSWGKEGKIPQGEEQHYFELRRLERRNRLQWWRHLWRWKQEEVQWEKLWRRRQQTFGFVASRSMYTRCRYPCCTCWTCWSGWRDNCLADHSSADRCPNQEISRFQNETSIDRRRNLENFHELEWSMKPWRKPKVFKIILAQTDVETLRISWFGVWSVVHKTC